MRSRCSGISISEPDLAILMRHRAVLFGLVGGLLLFATIKPAVRPVAFVVGLLSVASFLGLAWNIGQYNALLSRVVVVDILAFVCLTLGAAAYAYSHRGG